MLELRITGDKHPKTFTLVTDDSDAELARLEEIIFRDMEYDKDEGLGQWFNEHTAEQFAEGVEVPTDEVGSLEEVLEGDWFEEAQKIDTARQEAMQEAAAGGTE